MLIQKIDFEVLPTDANNLSVGDIFKDPEDDSYVMLIDYPQEVDRQYGVDLNTGKIYHWWKYEPYTVYKVTSVLGVDV